MSVSSDYLQSITVNGYTCHSCADVALAARHVDPAKAAAESDRNRPAAREAARDHFSPEARDVERLADAHEQLKVKAANPYAAAYGAGGTGATPGQFVDRTA